MKASGILISAALMCLSAAAQPPDAAQFQRASTTHRLAEFPKIHQDGRVWFQFKAPNAQKVQLRIGATNKMYDMEKLADGTWNLVIPYPGAGAAILLDDRGRAECAGPRQRDILQQRHQDGGGGSLAGGRFLRLKEVPHGHVLQHLVYSKVTQGGGGCSFTASGV